MAGGTLAGDVLTYPDLSQVRGTSTLEVSGGVVSGALAVRDSAEIVIRSGRVTGPLGAIEPTSTITIVGRDFAVDGVPVSFGVIPFEVGVLTGRLEAGGSIESVFGHAGRAGAQSDEVCYWIPCYGVVRLVEATPLPAASPIGRLALAAGLLVSALLLARRRSMIGVGPRLRRPVHVPLYERPGRRAGCRRHELDGRRRRASTGDASGEAEAAREAR